MITITALPAVQGCTAAAVPAVAYGVSKITESKAQPAQPAPAAPAQRTYPEYLTEMERINMEREKAGLSPRPIMTQEEWVKAQEAGRTPTPPTTSVQSPPAPTTACAPAPPAQETPDKNPEAK